MKIRTTKPEAGNKFFIRKANGGYSTCIKGKPTDKDCNVLANCVGYACGRFNEIVGEMKYPSLNCNAENFIERAKNTYGLEVGQTPKVGAIMCWQKGATLSGSDGAGHVAVVEKVISPTEVYTSESSWSGTAFFNATRKNTNGKWGINAYTFRGFIYNPAVPDEPTPEPTPTPEEFKVGDKVVPITLVNWKGVHLKQYDKEYTIMQIDNRGAVLGAPRNGKLQVWTVLKLDNIKKVN